MHPITVEKSTREPPRPIIFGGSWVSFVLRFSDYVPRQNRKNHAVLETLETIINNEQIQNTENLQTIPTWDALAFLPSTERQLGGDVRPIPPVSPGVLASRRNHATPARVERS